MVSAAASTSGVNPVSNQDNSRARRRPSIAVADRRRASLRHDIALGFTDCNSLCRTGRMCPPYEGSVPEPLRAPTGLALGTAAAGLNATEALARFRFPVQVSHQTQEPPSKSLPAGPGYYRAPRGAAAAQECDRRRSAQPW